MNKFKLIALGLLVSFFVAVGLSNNNTTPTINNNTNTPTVELNPHQYSDDGLRVQKEIDAKWNHTIENMTTPDLDSSPVGEAQADLDRAENDLEYEQRMNDIRKEYENE